MKKEPSLLDIANNKNFPQDVRDAARRGWEKIMTIKKENDFAETAKERKPPYKMGGVQSMIKTGDVFDELQKQDIFEVAVEGVKILTEAPVSVDIQNMDLSFLEKQHEGIYKEVIINNGYGLGEEIKGKTLIDVGANRGFVTLLALKMGAEKVIAVEPAKENLALLKLNIEHCGASDKVTLVNKAVWGVGKIDLFLEQQGEIFVVSDKGQKAKTITLKDLVKGQENLALKLDVEGSEYEIILNSDLQTLRKFSHIYMEIHAELNPKFKGFDLIKNKLKEAGFTQTKSSPLFWNEVENGQIIKSVQISMEVCRFEKDAKTIPVEEAVKIAPPNLIKQAEETGRKVLNQLPKNAQEQYGNNCERAIFLKDNPLYVREQSRYEWTRRSLTGNRILELGCSNGYGTRFLKDIPNLQYLGVDKDPEVIKLAEKEYGTENIKFECHTIEEQLAAMEKFSKEEDFEPIDTIIALEVLEHLENGLQIAQELKKYCKKLIITMPFNEPVGFWEPHHVRHGIQEKDLPEFEILYLWNNGQLMPYPTGEPTDLLFCKWYDTKEAIVWAEISTKYRYYKTLDKAIIGICMQTRPPQKLIIYDDSEEAIDFEKNMPPLYAYIFGLLFNKGIQVFVTKGNMKGQVQNHQRMLYDSNCDIIWRLDDDNIPEPDTLKILLDHMDWQTGAQGQNVWHSNQPIMPLPSYTRSCNYRMNFFDVCPEWYHWTGEDREFEHLYSTFIYRRWIGIKAGGYPMNLSPVGHQEEPIFSHKIFRLGWKLKVTNKTTVWHFREMTGGGIRSFKDSWLWEHDDLKAIEYLQSCGYELKKDKFIVLNNGQGDHLTFRLILPEIRAKYGETHNIIIACCFSEVFEDDKDCTIISLAELGWNKQRMIQYDIYAQNTAIGWKGNMEDAFRRMYL